MGQIHRFLLPSFFKRLRNCGVYPPSINHIFLGKPMVFHIYTNVWPRLYSLEAGKEQGTTALRLLHQGLVDWWLLFFFAHQKFIGLTWVNHQTSIFAGIFLHKKLGASYGLSIRPRVSCIPILGTFLGFCPPGANTCKHNNETSNSR